jgi:hypothetical protein
MNSAPYPPNSDRVVFLVGAGRSGTTLLYKLLCLHPRIAYISNYDARFGPLLSGVPASWIRNRMEMKRVAWFERSGNAYFVHRPLMKKLIPTPTEGEDVYAACGISRFLDPDRFPDVRIGGRLRARFEKIRRAMHAQWLLTKRTVNNRRIPLLERIFNAPLYIHLIRDGRDVANSLAKVEWWSDYVPWWAGRTTRELEQAGGERLAIAARNWAEEVGQLKQGLRTVGRERIFEIRYEDLLERPIEWLGGALRFLGLEADVSFEEAVRLLGLRYQPGAWNEAWTPEEKMAVMREIEPLLSEFGYV